jgi:restriction system protein
MFDLSTLLTNVTSAVDWRFGFATLALPVAVVLPAAVRRGGMAWLHWRLRMLPRDRYQVVHRPPLPVARDGGRVEHVVLSRHGVFLVQVVDRAGHIAGSMQDKVWTQKTARGTSTFHNPVRLGRRRAAMLAKSMNIDPAVLFPVVAFSGKCTFEQPMPANLTGPLGCIAYVQAAGDVLLDDDELAHIRAGLEAGLDDPRWRIHRERVPVHCAGRQVEGASAAASQPAGPVCPRCAAALGAYTYKTGHRAGQMFSGCTRFPACGFRAYPVRRHDEHAPLPA